MKKNLKVHQWLIVAHIFIATFQLSANGFDYQQQVNLIRGTITDERGDPLPGVNILIKGTTTGVVSNVDGGYSIQANENDILIFSFIGYSTVEVKVGSNRQLNITLNEDTKFIDEVVVVGFGTSKRRDVVGSITKISGDELLKTPVTNIAQSLQGMSSGVMVTNQSGHPGRSPEIKIRGLNSINLNTNPLWIVDGIPIQTGNLEQTQDGVIGVSALSMINPNDIESIEVLKDAAATAIYGSRGSGGVIIVTTKSNKGKLNAFQINYDGGISQVPFKQHDVFMKSKTWWEYYDIASNNAGNVPSSPDDMLTIKFWGERPPISRGEAENTDSDHLGAITQSAIYNQVGFSTNRGFETGAIIFTLNYRSEKGLIRNNDLDRITSRFTYNFQPLEVIEMGINSNFVYMKSNGIQSSSGKGDNGGWAQWQGTLPWFKIYDDNSQTGYWAVNSGFNLRAITDRNLQRYDVDQYRNINNAFVQWFTPLKGLTLRGEMGVDLIVNNNSYWRSALLASTSPYIAKAWEQSKTEARINYDAYATYEKTFNKIHDVNVTIGGEAFRNWGYVRYAEGQDLQTIYPELRNPLTMNSMYGRQTGDQYIMGFFARSNYKLLNRYIINASIRRDGHSAFNENNRWATFYAYGAGWIMSDEEFMSNIKWLNLIKLRGSYGITGNTNVSNSYTYMSWGLNTNSIFGVSYLPGSTEVGPLGSADLKWESTANLDLGFDYGLFNNRINGSFAFYKQFVSDLILQGNVQPSVGYNTNQLWENVGDLENWGVEFNVSSVNIQNRNFTWRTDFNISTNKNKIIKLNEAEKGKGKEDSNKIRKEGESLGTWYLANNVGVDPEKGVYMIEERNAEKWNTEFITETTGNIIPMTNNNVSNNKIIQSGKTELPKFYGGISNTLYYKGFDLNILFSYAGGHYLMNSLYNACDQMSLENNTIKDIVGNSWEKPGDNAKYPLLMAGESYYFDDEGNVSTKRSSFSNAGYTTHFLEKGDYIRLRNLQLGYTLPTEVVNKIKIKSVRFYVGVTNLFTITGYTGLDPESLNDLPIPRTVNFGLSLNL